MTDAITICDIITDCNTQCRLCGWECDGRPPEDDEEDE